MDKTQYEIHTTSLELFRRLFEADIILFDPPYHKCLHWGVKAQWLVMESNAPLLHKN